MSSDSNVGAVLQQRIHGCWSPFVFFSKKLFSTKSKYSAFDRELLAAYSAIRHFRFFLEAREFTLFTDHKPLTLALFCSSLPWSARQTHHLAFISEFTSDIVHVPGPKNIVADALSCPFSLVPASTSAVSVFSAVSLDLSATDLDFSSLPALQMECPTVKSMLSSPSLSVVSFTFQPPPSTVMCPHGLRGRWFQFLYAIGCSYLYTGSPILVFELPGGCCPPDSCGPALRKTSVSGRGPASSANRVRSSPTSGLLFLVSMSLVDVFLTCIWIWWDRCLQAKDIVTY